MEVSKLKHNQVSNVGIGLEQRIVGNLKSTESDKIEQAAKDFEGMFVQMMLKEMWKTTGSQQGGGAEGKSREMEIFHDMLNERLAEEISKGQGLGVQEVLINEISKLDDKKEKLE